MKLSGLTFLVIVLLQIQPLPANAQVWPIKKHNSVEKATKDLETRQKKVNQGNAFNELQPMGTRKSLDRDDFIWSSETAFTVSEKTGNLSLVSPSRYGLKNGYEISSIVPINYWVPNIMVKKTHYNKKILVATRHGLYSASPGLKWAQTNNLQTIADTLTYIPFILTLRNEVIVSKYFGGDEGCSKTHPYLIITAAASVDAGFTFEKNQLKHIDEHILGSRSTALTGQGLLYSARLRADYQLPNEMLIEGGFKFFFGNFPGQFAMEHHAGLQNFVSKNISVTLGYILSMGSFSDTKIKIYPSFECTWYFGLKPTHSRGLFKKKMF